MKNRETLTTLSLGRVLKKVVLPRALWNPPRLPTQPRHAMNRVETSAASEWPSERATLRSRTATESLKSAIQICD